MVTRSFVQKASARIIVTATLALGSVSGFGSLEADVLAQLVR